MLSLPSSNSELREKFDIMDLAEKRWSTFLESKAAARNVFAKSEGVKKVNTLTMRADGSIHLIEWGPRGGKKVLWNFGKYFGRA
jgi:hypothetical protein